MRAPLIVGWLAAIGLAAAASIGMAAAPASEPDSRTYPTRAQCWAGIAQAYPKNTAFYNPCGPQEMFCPNSGSPGRKSGHFIPNAPTCVPLSPAELAQREAERAKAAKFETELRAEVARLGAHREAEIRRKLELRDKAQALRPKMPQPESPRQCAMRTSTRSTSETGKNRSDALLKVNGKASAMCGIGSTYRGHGEPTCKEVKPVVLPKPPIGDCLACISLKGAIASGYVPGKGWPQPASTWTCSISVTCEVEQCSTGPAGVTRQ